MASVQYGTVGDTSWQHVSSQGENGPKNLSLDSRPPPIIDIQTNNGRQKQPSKMCHIPTAKPSI